MILNITDTSKYLYHYTNEHALIEHIIPTRKLRFGKLKNTNDPKEYFPYSPVFSSSVPVSMDQCKAQLQKERNKYKILALCKDSGFECVERGYCKPRMWSQYGNSHRGVCLIIDKQKFENEVHSNYSVESVFFSDIKYIEKEDARLILQLKSKMEDEVQQFVSDNKSILFFQKSIDWQNESEFRCLVYSENEYEKINLDNILVGIVFGHDCPLLISEMVLEEFPNIGSAKLEWLNGFPSPTAISSGYLDLLKNRIRGCVSILISKNNSFSISDASDISSISSFLEDKPFKDEVLNCVKIGLDENSDICQCKNSLKRLSQIIEEIW